MATTANSIAAHEALALLRSGGRVPPLEQGDRLAREEFERRYAAMPRVKRAELVAGQVYMQAPVSFGHSDAHYRLIGWSHAYVMGTPGVQGADNPTLKIDEQNELQPDLLLRLSRGGGSRIDDQGYLCGPPEFVAEVAASSASYDVHDKLQVYCQAGVREYLVWRVFDGELDWFELRDGAYQPLAADGTMLKSLVFPGLWLDRPAMLAGNMAAVIAGLQQGLAAPEHARFAEQLASQPGAN